MTIIRENVNLFEICETINKTNKHSHSSMCSNEYFCNFFFVEIQKSFLGTSSKLILKYSATFIRVCHLFLKFFFRQNILEVDSIRMNPRGNITIRKMLRIFFFDRLVQSKNVWKVIRTEKNWVFKKYEVHLHVVNSWKALDVYYYHRRL